MQSIRDKQLAIQRLTTVIYRQLYNQYLTDSQPATVCCGCCCREVTESEVVTVNTAETAGALSPDGCLFAVFTALSPSLTDVSAATVSRHQ